MEAEVLRPHDSLSYVRDHTYVDSAHEGAPAAARHGAVELIMRASGRSHKQQATGAANRKGIKIACGYVPLIFG